MDRKKLLRSVVAVLCIVSMVLGYFGGLAPESKVEAAETVETLPTDFTEVTPKDFGIDDFSGNTEKEVHASSLKPVTSTNKVIIRMKVVFGAGTTINFLKYDDYAAAGKKGFRLFRQNNGIRLTNDGNTNSFTVGETSGKYFWQLDPPSSEIDYDTTEIDLAITMEMVVRNDKDALKVGIWINEVLYDNTFVYITGRTISENSIYMDMNVLSCTSPFTTAPSTAQDGYRVVTPATFGIPDATSTDGDDEDSLPDGLGTISTPDSQSLMMDLDKVRFETDIRFNATSGAASLITYLYNSQGKPNLQLYVGSGSTYYLYLTNRRTQGSDTNLYIGGEFGEDGYVSSELSTPRTSSQAAGAPSAASFLMSRTYMTGITDIRNNIFSLAITTEFIDFDHDDKMDDLQIGIYINDVLYRDTYCYYVDYEETTFQAKMTTENLTHIYSPSVEPEDLGLVVGEYAESDNGFFESSIATSKVMNGTTLSTNILFNGADASLYYGCDASNNTRAIKLTSTTEGIQVSHTYGEQETPIVLLEKSNVAEDLVNNQFKLKLSTDVLDSDGDTLFNDVKLGIQINNKSCSFIIPNVALQLTGRIGVECTNGATIMLGSFASDTVDESYYCIDDGGYTKKLEDGVTRLTVDGKAVTDEISISQPGKYRIVMTENRQLYRENVTVYYRYDVNESQTVEILDLVRMLKVANESTREDTVAELGKVGKLAIAYESAETWSNDIALPVLEFMRRSLVGAGAPEEKTAEITSINREQLQQFGNEHGAITGDFTFTVDLASESVNRTEQIWILSTDAKYISVNGNYPTIQFKLMNKALTRQLYISQTYRVGDKNELVERQLRVPETLEDYTVLQVSFVIPDGVALYINDISAENNIWDENTKEQFLSEKDDTIYSADDDVKYLAHSGFIGYAPDNTLLGFEMAGKMGFKSLITIPKFTKATDEEKTVGVCFHDEYLHERLLYDDGTELPVNKEIGIEDYTYSELEQFDAGLREGEIYSCDVPTLYEYFTICDKYKMAPVFSLHPDLTVDQWTYVKNLLQEFKDETGYSWIYDHFQIKVGTTKGLKDAFSVFGFDIGYIIIQTPAWTAASKIGVLTDSGILAAAEEKAQENPTFDMFDKVSVEIFKSDPQLEEEIAYLRDYGFTRISLAPGSGLSGGFSGEEISYYKDLGVNSFTVDFHGSMGLNW